MTELTLEEKKAKAILFKRVRFQKSGINCCSQLLPVFETNEIEHWFLEAVEALERFKWKPIETAPKDGSEILLLIPLNWEVREDREKIGTGNIVGSYWWDKGVWRSRVDYWVWESKPTHWMPMPPLNE